MMPTIEKRGLSRRNVLAGTGALIVSFSVLSRVAAQEGEVSATEKPNPMPDLPGSLKKSPFLDSWIRIDAGGGITIFTGKAELGQGIKTALLQVAAEELEVEPGKIALVTADTDLTPNEGFTAGSQSMQNSGTAIRHAAAQTREILIAEASQRLGLPPDQLRADGGNVHASDGRSVGYGTLVSDSLLHVEAKPQVPLKQRDAFRIMGTPMQRVDIPAKVTGGAAFVHDLRFNGMAHARVVRPPSPGARLVAIESTDVEKAAGVVKVVRDGSFLAVVAEGEYQAVNAMRLLAQRAQWEEKETMPKQAELPALLQGLPVEEGVVADRGSTAAGPGRTFRARFTRPYQIHGSIGPSCAVARFENGSLTIWSHTQGVYPDRKAIAEMLGLPVEQVRCVHVEGSGCYGHNGADDAAADAALIARAVPGRAVRVQWMREQEHAWEPYGPAMVTEVRARIAPDGKVADWNFELWSNTHSTRPGAAGELLPARHLASPFAPTAPKLRISPSGNGDRNSVPLYTFSHIRAVWHFLQEMPLRVSALRALGAYMNVFSTESFVDELAFSARVDPVEFRLQHLDDPRARDVVTLAADRFGWGSGDALPAGRGRGFGFARYKNLAAYCAVAAEVEIERETGRTRVRRAVAAIDSGEIVNPDGIRNQTEGGILQAISWTLYEAVTFDETRITSIDWSSYPILRFGAVPDSVEVHVMDRPGQPFLGTGEAAQGPTAAAVANAIADACGKRLYDLPLNRDRVKAAIDADRSGARA